MPVPIATTMESQRQMPRPAVVIYFSFRLFFNSKKVVVSKKLKKPWVSFHGFVLIEFYSFTLGARFPVGQSIHGAPGES